MLDYEYTEVKIFNNFSTMLLMPKFIPDNRLLAAGINLNKVVRYNGFKEELYLKDFVPNPDFRKTIGISDENILIVIRPPSIVGNYHDPKSEELLIKAINYFSTEKNSIVLIVNRTENERKFILNKISKKDNIRFLDKAVDGLQLLFAADISISGGGTMNREAALLGTKSYSIFTGKRPYLDEYLQDLGKLKFIEKKDEFEKIPIARYKKNIPEFENNLVSDITNLIINFS
jgi:predicted glycosyltransferase